MKKKWYQCAAVYLCAFTMLIVPTSTHKSISYIGVENKFISAEETKESEKLLGSVAQAATTTSGYVGVITVKINEASGIEVYGGNGSLIDASNKKQGYLMVKQEGSAKKLKVQIICGDTSYNYDLNNQGGYEAFPMNMGDGTYTIRVAEQASGNTYAVVYQTKVDISLSSPTVPYEYPNQRVKFTNETDAVKLSYDLCAGLTTDEQKVQAIYDYIKNNITYDYNKAATVQSGYIPDADSTLVSKNGICYDYSVLMAVMLRAQNIPAQVIFGSASNAPSHAWNKIYYDGNWQLYDATFAAGGATGSSYTEAKRY